MKTKMKTKHALCGLLSGLLLLAAGTAQTHAGLIFVGNSSFESPVQTDNGFTTNVVPGWGIDLVNAAPNPNIAGVYNPLHGAFPGTTGSPGTLPGSADGVQSAYINNLGNSLYQDVGLLQPFTIYTLTVAGGTRIDYGAGSAGTISLVNGTSNTGTVLSSFAVTPPTGTFADFATTFTTGASVAGDLTIAFTSTSGGLSEILFDNVRLDATPVPEPGTALLLLGSGAMLLLRRRRRA